MPNQVHQERAARSQSLFREVNERIAALPDRPPATFVEFVCECCLDGCAENVSMTSSEYEDVRKHPAWFAVVPGHVDANVERVIAGVGGIDRYDVVEKIEAAAEVAVHLDPRGRQAL